MMIRFNGHTLDSDKVDGYSDIVEESKTRFVFSIYLQGLRIEVISGNEIAAKDLYAEFKNALDTAKK